MRVEVPERLVKEPHLFLSVAFLSGSGFLPFLHPGSGMINTTGFHVIGPDHPGGARTQAMIERNIGRAPTAAAAAAGHGRPWRRCPARRRCWRFMCADSACASIRRIASSCGVEGNLRGGRSPGGQAPRVDPLP